MGEVKTETTNERKLKRNGEPTMQSMDVKVAKKLVSFVRANPGATVEQIVRNVPELADPEMRDFAIDGWPRDQGFLIKITNGCVYLGAAAYLVESSI